MQAIGGVGAEDMRSQARPRVTHLDAVVHVLRMQAPAHAASQQHARIGLPAQARLHNGRQKSTRAGTLSARVPATCARGARDGLGRETTPSHASFLSHHGFLPA